MPCPHEEKTIMHIFVTSLKSDTHQFTLLKCVALRCGTWSVHCLGPMQGGPHRFLICVRFCHPSRCITQHNPNTRLSVARALGALSKTLLVGCCLSISVHKSVVQSLWQNSFAHHSLIYCRPSLHRAIFPNLEQFFLLLFRYIHLSWKRTTALIISHTMGFV